MQPTTAPDSLPPASLDSLSSQIEQKPMFPAWLLNTGFIVALVLACLCLITSGFYLYRFQGVTQDSVLKVLNGHMSEVGLYQVALGAQLYLARVQLVSCGIFVGLAFGFLGFALFLLGVKGQMTAEGSGAALTLKVLNLAPGAFVLLCATILVGVCVTHPLSFDYDQQGGRPQRTLPAATRDSAATTPIPQLPALDSARDNM